ncbi:MAG: hypothetical protein ACRD3M_05715 [Thermoanaerobaculia bacterium]
MSRALEEARIRAVLSGGACAAIHTAGLYQSVDLDFIVHGDVSRDRLDAAMVTLRFERRGDRYLHPSCRFYVEFPPGPLAIGSDYEIRPELVRAGRFQVRTLSATDSCRDRLAAYLHWGDSQSLETAVLIGIRNDVDLKSIRAWAEKEGRLDRFEEFRARLEIARRRQSARSRRKRTGPAPSR